MKKLEKVEKQPLNQTMLPEDTELAEAELDEVSGGTKRTGGSSWLTVLAKAYGELAAKQADKIKN